MCVYMDRKDVSYWPSLCSSRNLEKWAFWWTIKREARARPSGRSGRPLCRLMLKLTKLCGGVPWLPSFLVTAWKLFVIIFPLCGNSIVALLFFSSFRVFAIFSWLFLRNNRWSSSRPRFFRCHSIILNKWCPQELSIIAVLVLLGHVPGRLAAISFPCSFVHVYAVRTGTPGMSCPSPFIYFISSFSKRSSYDKMSCSR